MLHVAISNLGKINGIEGEMLDNAALRGRKEFSTRSEARQDAAPDGMTSHELM